MRTGRAIPFRRRGGFTLVELVVVLAIVALLIALLAPALVTVRQQAKSFLCMDHGRAAALDFRMFADSYGHPWRGDSEDLPGARFSAIDFQESLYGVDEFWSAAPPIHYQRERYRPGQKPIICPSVPVGLERLRGYQTLEKIYVRPLEKVSYAMNRRLYEAPTIRFGTIPYDEPVLLTDRILNHPNVPLLLDVDGEAAVRAGSADTRRVPFFIGPNYETRSYWFPAFRHRGKLTIAFVGGHVLSTDHPLSDPSIDWDYHPPLDGP